MQEIPPPPPLGEPALAPAPRGPKVAPVPSRDAPRIGPSMAAAPPAEAIGAGILWGRVLDEQGQPVVGYAVGDQKEGEGPSYEFARTTVTDATGAWRLEGCPAGKHTVTLFDRTEARFEAHAPRRARTVFLELATGEIRQVELGVSPDDVMWTGRARTRDGTPFRCGWDVRLRSSALELARNIGEDATFRWKLPPGRYAVTVAQGLQEFELDLPGAPGSGTGRSPTEAYVGAGRDLDADIVVMAGRVSGKVRAPACIGQGVLRFMGVSRALSPEDGMYGLDPPLHLVASDGSFGPVFLPPGRYWVSLMGWWDADDPHLVDVGLRTPGGEPVEIQIAEGGEITGLELLFE